MYTTMTDKTKVGGEKENSTGSMWHPLSKKMSSSHFQVTKGSNSARQAVPVMHAPQTQRYARGAGTTNNSLSREQESSSIEKKMRD
jgi:hypothetical protein